MGEEGTGEPDESAGIGPPPDHFDDMDDRELMAYDEMYQI